MLYDLAIAILNLYPDAISEYAGAAGPSVSEGVIGCAIATLWAVGLPTVFGLGIWASLD